MQEFIPVEEARRLVLERCRPTPPERVPLLESLGRTLAEDAVSPDDIPPFDNSAMDGYAVRMADVRRVPVTLRVSGAVHAGDAPSGGVGEGACVQVMTGAPLPPGAEAVVPVEWTEREGGAVVIRRAPEPGQYLRRAGRDVARGSTVLRAGELVTPPVVGMLAALGLAGMPVRRRPRVAVIATGDELAEPGEPLGPGKIRNANGPALAAQAAAAGAHVQPPLVARDTPESLRAAVEAARDADVLVLSGGVSVGERDHVKEVLEALGVELLFWKVRQRPGKPLAFGVLGSRLVFALPGNPVSSAVCFQQYVRPALCALLGRPPGPVLHTALLDAPVPKAPGLHHFVRARAWVDGQGVLRAAPTGAQDSNLYSSVVHADGLLHLPESSPDLPPGAPVPFEWLQW